MRNYLKNKMKDRLAYCMEWKNSVDIYLANKEITKKTDIEYYRSRPILKLILDIYFIPTNFIRLLKFLRMLHEYKKNQIEINKNRFEQELIFYLEKLDITEEFVRLESHCIFFQDTLKESNPNGKKLGFILQEMGREINTIGSKANYSKIQKLVVEMKDELEKIKEQILNVL